MRSLTLALVALLLAGCAEAPVDDTTPTPTGASRCEAFELLPPDAAWVAQKPHVRIETSKGAFVVEVETERAPITSANFLNLTRSGFYNGTLFHRVVHDFVIQAGDPLSKDEDPSNDGSGGPGYAIPDEFNPTLRHDAIGVLSMANSGPNSGGSQFFVTLSETPHLDDRHAVFARVIEGLDVVRSIGVAQVDADDRPLEPVRIEGATVLDAATEEARHAVSAHVVIGSKKTEPGHAARFAVVLQNQGTTRDRIVLGASAPEGWQCQLDVPVVVPAGTGRVVFVTFTPPMSAAGATTLPLSVASSGGAHANTSLEIVISDLGRHVEEGDRVVGNYAGLLLDGRLFDTSFAAVGRDPAQPKFDTLGGFRDRGSYNPFTFTVGSGVIPGFTNLAKTASVGEIVTTFIPARDAYATGNQYEAPLTGRDLVFELEIVSAT